MKQTLATSEAKQFEYLMMGDEVIVRNYKKILAFFTIHFANHPVSVREVLAVPEFSGSKVEEKIEWTTELFESTPVKLSSLKGKRESDTKPFCKKPSTMSGIWWLFCPKVCQACFKGPSPTTLMSRFSVVTTRW